MQGTNIFLSTNNECSYVSVHACVRAHARVFVLPLPVLKARKMKYNRFEVK
jgi:hypothetical protein